MKEENILLQVAHCGWDENLGHGRICGCRFARKDTDGRGGKFGVRFRAFHSRLSATFYS